MITCTLFALRKVTKYPAKLGIMQKKSRFNLDKVISVNLRVTLVWFVGLSLMMVNLLTSSNDIIILTLLLVLAFGLILFFVP